MYPRLAEIFWVRLHYKIGVDDKCHMCSYPIFLGSEVTQAQTSFATLVTLVRRSHVLLFYVRIFVSVRECPGASRAFKELSI